MQLGKALSQVVTSPFVAPVVNLNTVSLPIFPCSPSIRRIAKISKIDVELEIKYWELSVVCYVTSANPPLQVVDGFVHRIWKDLHIDKLGMVNRGVFLVRFTLKEHQDQACNMNGILFDKKPFIVKPWYPNISYEKSSLASIPVWVKLPNLDVIYWTENILKQIVGYLGNVLKVDNATLTKSRMMYARVLVDMTLADSFPEELFFSNEHEQLITQRVQYDWLPTWCTKCAQFGHVVDSCRVGSKASRLQVDENGFRPLRKAFQSRGNKQGGNKWKVAVMQELAPQQTVTASEEVQPVSYLLLRKSQLPNKL